MRDHQVYERIAMIAPSTSCSRPHREVHALHHWHQELVEFVPMAMRTQDQKQQAQLPMKLKLYKLCVKTKPRTKLLMLLPAPPVRVR